MQCPRNLVILLKTGTAAEDFRQPELTNCTFHVTNLALRRRGSLDPLRWLPSNTADHVSMSESLGCPLLRFRTERRRNRLRDPRVERRCPAGDNQVVVVVVASARPGIAVAGTRPRKRRVCTQRRRHLIKRITLLAINDLWLCM